MEGCCNLLKVTGSILVYISVAVVEHHYQGRLWKEEFIWLMTPEG